LFAWSRAQDRTRRRQGKYQSMHQVVDAVKRATDVIAEIRAARCVLSAGIEQINRAMSQYAAPARVAHATRPVADKVPAGSRRAA
jgi:hypothetical protein